MVTMLVAHGHTSGVAFTPAAPCWRTSCFLSPKGLETEPTTRRLYERGEGKGAVGTEIRTEKLSFPSTVP